MIIPQYWAEGRVKGTVDGRQVTIRRFGWSDESQEDAQLMADVRAEDALNALAQGLEVPRRESKVPYNGAEGVPIREEILARYGETVITRNLYGARCLNTPNVLFADVDFEDSPSLASCMTSVAVLVTAAAGLGIWLNSLGVGIAFSLFAALFLASPTAWLWMRARNLATGGVEKRARDRIERFIVGHPEWHLRLYRTPVGFRVLALHRTFDPHDAEVSDFFSAIGADPVYVRMCLNQHCFRARLTPKPWRIGIDRHIKPYPGVWPINPDRLPERQRWVKDYERKARDYAACRYLESLGSSVTDPGARLVQEVHDRECRATSTLPAA